MDVNRVLVLHRLVRIPGLRKLRRVVEKPRGYRLRDAVQLARVRRYLDLNPLAEALELVADITRAIQAPDLNVVLVAPLPRNG